MQIDFFSIYLMQSLAAETIEWKAAKQLWLVWKSWTSSARLIYITSQRNHEITLNDSTACLPTASSGTVKGETNLLCQRWDTRHIIHGNYVFLDLSV